MNARLLIALTAVVSCVCARRLSDYKYPFLNPTLSWEMRVDDLVSRLTLEEIASQTMAIYGKSTPAIDSLGIKPYVWITECIRGEVGTNTTAFPQSIGLAASFSPELLFNVSHAISYEVRAHWNGNAKQGKYISGQGLSCFSPVINIMRHPLWGRNQETYGEDPFLSGELVSNFVKGLQGEHERYVRASAGCKHFDVHGGPENIPVSRFSFDAKVTTEDWQMTFLPAFKACVRAGTYSLMCSYNSLNGVPTCANEELLTRITREDWGFRGYIISDAGAINNIITQHHYLNNTVDTAAACIKAGCNIELATTVFADQLKAMKAGKLTEEEIRNNVKPLFYTRMRLGEFDPPEMNPYNKIDVDVIQSQTHRDLAITAATKSFVLLKNTNKFLPFMKTFKHMAVVGPFADNMDQLFGDYGSDVQKAYTKTPLKGLSGLASQVASASGCDDTKCKKYDSSTVKKAVEGTDLVVVCLGTGQAVEAEGNDRADITLPGSQLQLLKDAVDNSGSAPILVLLFNAGPLDISYAKMSDRVMAIMACFFPAQGTGDALMKVLTQEGGVVPAGRLQATWPTELTQVPPITDYTMKGRTYRYYNGEPMYPFGYGLSYTEFKYNFAAISPPFLKQYEDFVVDVQVENTGKVDADEVIQVYVCWPNTTITTPKLQLVAFNRVMVQQTKAVSQYFKISGEQLAVWADDDSGFTVIPGEYTLYVGGQQPNQPMNVGSNVLEAKFYVGKE